MIRMGTIEQGCQEWEGCSTDWAKIRQMGQIKYEREEWDGLSKDEKDGTN